MSAISIYASLVVGLLAAMMVGCSTGAADYSFADDVAFLRQHRDTIVLASPDGQAKVAVVPSICGRVFTSTATGDAGPGYGFLNREVIASKTILPKINGYGGEDRFWLGPEGGQFAIFFGAGDRFTLDDWQTPAPIDTEAYRVTKQDATSVTMTHEATFTNFSGHMLRTRIDRVVRLIDAGATCRALGVARGDASCVAFETLNAITNTGPSAWSKEIGALSIWTLGMFKPSPECVAVIPYVPGSEQERGPVVRDDYFGKVPGDRLAVNDRAIFFKADGAKRTKIGTSPQRSRPICGSWDPSLNVLTLVSFSLPVGATEYVNSMWEMQKDPFAGDVINSYNDGGTPSGDPTFYELETSSPALALSPGQTGRHVSRTVHFTGPRPDLDRISRVTLGVSLQEIESSLR
jgi:hypothetical protein